MKSNLQKQRSWDRRRGCGPSETRVRISAQARHISLLQNVQTRCGVYPASNSKGITVHPHGFTHLYLWLRLRKNGGHLYSPIRHHGVDRVNFTLLTYLKKTHTKMMIIEVVVIVVLLLPLHHPQLNKRTGRPQSVKPKD